MLSWCRVCRVVVMTGLTRYVERLKHDLGRVLAVLRRVEGGLRLRGSRGEKAHERGQVRQEGEKGEAGRGTERERQRG